METKTKLICCLLMIVSTVSFASIFNKGVVKGKVTDENKSTLPFATIVLKHASDSAIYKGELSDENGSFEFGQVPAGDYLLEVQYVGYDKPDNVKISVSLEEQQIDLGSILMKSNVQQLQSFEVVAERPMIEREIDKTVVNIENSPLSSGSSVFETLEKLPGVTVTQNGGVAVRGKQGVIILMNGKQIGLAGQDLSDILKGIPSSNIKKIEIITAPSAKYDASGNAGIINIITKKNLVSGLNGNLNVNVGKGRYGKVGTGFTLNYKTEHINFYVNYSFAYRKYFNNLVLRREFYENDKLDMVFDTDNYILFPFKNHLPSAGVDINLSKKTTLSVSTNAVSNRYESTADNHTSILNGMEQEIGSYDFTNRSNDLWFNYGLNTQLKHVFDSIGRELTVDLDYASYGNNSNQEFYTQYNDAEGNYLSDNKLIGDQDGELSIYAFRTDYSGKWRENYVLESGLKSSYVASDSDVKFYNEEKSEENIDSLRSNHFIYKENINAGYLNLKNEWQKISWQLGLRLENTRSDGKQLITGEEFIRNYTQLFPSLFLQYKLSSNHSLNINTGRRIDRPAYRQMNPFRRLIDATTFDQGNPFLKPQFSYNTELTYGFKDAFFITGAFGIIKDNITEVLIQDSEKRETVQTVVNLDDAYSYSLNISYSKKLTDFWLTNSNFMCYYNHYTGNINSYQLNRGMPSFYLQSTNNFFLSKGISAELGLMYSYRNLYGVTIINDLYSVSIGAKKNVLKDKGTLIFNVSDIFWTSYPSGDTEFGNVKESWSAKRETRVAMLTFSYRFGSGQPLRMNRRTGADEEKRRTTNS